MPQTVELRQTRIAKLSLVTIQLLHVIQVAAGIKEPPLTNALISCEQVGADRRS